MENKLVQLHHEIFLPHLSCCRETNWVHIFNYSEANATFSQNIFSLLNFKLKLISFNVLHVFLCLFLASLLFFPRTQFPLPLVPAVHISVSTNLWAFSTSSCQSAQQLVFRFSNRDAVGAKLFLPVFCTCYQLGTEGNITLAPEWKQQISMTLWAVCYFC